MKTVDEQLEEALAKAATLEADAKAGAALLTEASAQIDTLKVQVTELNADRERLAADLTTARQSIESLSMRAKELEAKEQDLEKRASLRAAQIVASTGTQAPAKVTPQAENEMATLIEQFKAITDPAEQTAFWRKLTPQQKAAILNHQ
jgi:chromosome segregation ATPase